MSGEWEVGSGKKKKGAAQRIISELASVGVQGELVPPGGCRAGALPECEAEPHEGGEDDRARPAR